MTRGFNVSLQIATLQLPAACKLYSLHMEAIFLKFSADKLEQLAGRIEVCLQKLDENQVWMRGNENQNAIGNLVLHLCGNMRQWIIAKIGGGPDDRARDAEFAARGGMTIPQLTAHLRATVSQAVSILRALSPERLAERVQVQAYDVTVLEAIYHVVEHFSQHTGQILFAAKLHTGEDLGFYKHLNKPQHSQETP